MKKGNSTTIKTKTMKKSVQILLGAILFFFLIILCSGAENPAERNYPITFGDTITFNAPFITDNGDTATLIKLNDSVCIVMNGDTARIDGGGSIDNETDPIYSASVASGITSSDTANWNSVSVYNEIDTTIIVGRNSFFTNGTPSIFDVWHNDTLITPDLYIYRKTDSLIIESIDSIDVIIEYFIKQL